MCNAFAQAVIRRASKTLRDRYPDEYLEAKIQAEIELYPQVVEDFNKSYPLAVYAGEGAGEPIMATPGGRGGSRAKRKTSKDKEQQVDDRYGRPVEEMPRGDERYVYPVRDGQLWAVGGHFFMCSDLVVSPRLKDLVTTMGTASLVYCDPPWGQAMADLFRGSQPSPSDVTWEDVYRAVGDLGHGLGVPVWVEGATRTGKHGQHVPELIGRHDKYTAYVDVVYYRRYPSGLFYSGPVDPGQHLLDKLRGMDDNYLPGTVMAAQSHQGVVVDPCSGRGQTSRQAHLAGWLSINNDVHPENVSASMARLAMLIGKQPRLVE